MADFRVRRGLSTTLFIDGEVNPKLVIEEGTWYLCTDTAELFLGAVGDDNKLTLKRINGDNSAVNRPTTSPLPGPGEEPNDDFAELQYEVGVLQDELALLKNTKIFKRVLPEEVDNLPSENDEGFNPNITYYTQQPDTDIFSTFIYDYSTQGYICLNSTIESDGVRIETLEIDTNGELIVLYTDGTRETLGPVVGKDGEDGLTTALKFGDTIYTHNNGIIELPDFATKDYVDQKIAAIEYPTVDLTGYATKEYVDEQIESISVSGLPSNIILFGGDANPMDDK